MCPVRSLPLLLALALAVPALAPAVELYPSSLDPPPPVIAASPCQDLARAVMAAAQEVGDPDLGTAVTQVIEKGFLPRIVLAWESLHGPPEPGDPPLEWWREDVDPCADLARIRATARSFLKQTYPGMPLTGGRTFRSNEDPPEIWRSLWYVDGGQHLVFVDITTWTAHE